MNELKNSNCVIVLAQGRSGSTLLLRVLNEIEGYNICGENHGAIRKLYEFNQLLQETTKIVPKQNGRFYTYEELMNLPKYSDSYSGFEWYNVYQIESIQEKLRELIFEMFNPERKFKVWGFKEIRFGGETTKYYKRFENELNFLKNLFPKTKFIFLTRDIEQLLKSAWWSKNPDTSRKILEKQEIFFDKYYQNNADFCYSITYHDLVKNTEVLYNMYEFLGESFDLDKYKTVLSR